MVVQPVVTDSVAAKGGGRKVPPINRHHSIQRRRDAVADVFNAGRKLCAHTLVAEAFEYSRGLYQIGHCEAISEGAAYRAERPERFFAAALLLPKPGQARRGAQFP